MKCNVIIVVDFGDGPTETVKLENFEYEGEIPFNEISELFKKARKRYHRIGPYLLSDIKITIEPI